MINFDEKEKKHIMIEIRNMTTEYEYGDLFRIPDMRFEKGRISTIIGRNGCGKSTLLKTVAGMKQYKGNILINGKESRDYKSIERAREVAFLPQNLRNVGIDVETLVEHGRYAWHGNLRRMSENDMRIVAKALLLTGMEPYRDRSLSELSGGERQRAYLAMVIAQDTPMIMLDEPTTYMDLSVQQSFFEILTKLAAEGRGIVMVCHDIEQTLTYSDMIYIMDNRTVIKSGTPDEIIADDETFRKVFGVTIKKMDDSTLLYPYAFLR